MNIATRSVTEAKTVHPRRAVLEMPEYHPPLAGRNALRLDFNENTFAPSPKVLEKLRAITAEGLTKYPEREPVERIVAKHFGLQTEQVLLTNGVDEAIHLMCAAFLEPEDEALISTPTFFMYDVSIQMMTSHLRKVQADATLEFPFERFMAAITERTKLIIVASPNNPTGAVVNREHLLAIAAAAPQAVLMVDEAYYHFHGESTMNDFGGSAKSDCGTNVLEGVWIGESSGWHVGWERGAVEICAEGELALQRKRCSVGVLTRGHCR